MIEFTEAVKLFYSNYVKFEGRSTRAEYWWVQLYLVFVLIVFAVLMVFSAGSTGGLDAESLSPITGLFALLFIVFVIAHVLPGISLQVRRFHDLGQTGWLVLVFVLLGLIPLVGLLSAIGQIIWFCFRGTNGSNRYGPDPLSSEFEVEDRNLNQNIREPMFKP